MTDPIRAALERLTGDIQEARDCIEGWGAYASEYFQQKHDLAGDLAAFDRKIAAARAVLSRWGHQPAPPAEGEVAELVTLLAVGADCSGGAKLSPDQCHRAAELLQQQHPTPVPVSERLPGPGDRNTEGKCWWFCTAYPGDWPHWILGNEAFCDPTHWLPAHALPIPQEEAQ